MTNANLTLIAALLDRSGSMHSIKLDVEGGFNSLIESQKKEPGEAMVSLAQFDDLYESVYSNKPIQDVPPLVLIPGNMTALYDAVGKFVTEIGAELHAQSEEKRPGKVIVVIMTDGFENASKEWRSEAVQELVKKQTEDYGWEFLYLGAGDEKAVFQAAQSIGVPQASAMAYAASGTGVNASYSTLDSYVTTTRGGGKAQLTDEDRKAAKGK